MQGWFQKLLKSRGSLSKQHNKEATKGLVTSVSGVLTSSSSTLPSCSSSSLSSSPGRTPSKPQQLPTVLSSELRWKRKYDIFVCHSSAQSDIEEAARLVSFLEDSPRSLRCFLWQRDACPGGAVCTEFCQAVENSHLRALLITPSFVQDDWCNYMMHQVLTEGPMSNRMIPLLHSLSHSQYPKELKFYYYIDLSRNPVQAYTLVNRTVLQYLEDLVKKEMTHNFQMSGSSSGLDGADSSQEDKLISQHSPAGTAIPLEVMQKSHKHFSDISCDQ